MTLDETRYKSHCTVNVDSKLNLKGNALSYFSPYLVAFQFFLKIKRTRRVLSYRRQTLLLFCEPDPLVVHVYTVYKDFDPSASAYFDTRSDISEDYFCASDFFLMQLKTKADKRLAIPINRSSQDKTHRSRLHECHTQTAQMYTVKYNFIGGKFLNCQIRNVIQPGRNMKTEKTIEQVRLHGYSNIMQNYSQIINFAVRDNCLRMFNFTERFVLMLSQRKKYSLSPKTSYRSRKGTEHCMAPSCPSLDSPF